MEKNAEAKKKRVLTARRRDRIFVSLLLLWPILQFAVFYIGVNFNSLLISFQNITYVNVDSVGKTVDGATAFTWTFSQYKKAFAWLGSSEFGNMIWVSVKSYLISTCVSVPLGLLFAYYIFKKLPGWSSFRVLLFLPMILSGVVMAAIFRYFIEDGLPGIIEDLWYEGILHQTAPEEATISLFNPLRNTSYATLMFFNIWIGFGTSALMYSNKMSGLSEEAIEAAHMDGATGLKEFWYIILPYAYPTLSVFLITGFAQICSNQYNVYNMFSSSLTDNSLRNLGYYLFVEVNTKFRSGGGMPELPYYAAIGVILTLIAVPLTLLLKYVLEKFGPSED